MEEGGKTESTESTESTPLVIRVASSSTSATRDVGLGIWAYFMKFFNFILPFIIFGIGISALMIFEDWPFITSSYVITQIVTTIGYGEFTVQTAEAKVFMSFYAFSVLVVLAYYHSVMIGGLVTWECDTLRKYLRQWQVAAYDHITTEEEAKRHYGAFNMALASFLQFIPLLIFGTCFYRYTEHCTCSFGSQGVEGCIDDTYEQCVLTGGYTKDWSSSFYMSAITLTTVGFGDYQPRTTLGRIVGIIWMLIGTIVTGSFISSLSTYLFEARQTAEREAAFSASDAADIDKQTFEKMDKNHDGNLSKGEFLAYTLVKYNLADEALVDEICSLYDRLDENKTNKVTLEMIEKSKRKRMERQNSKYGSAPTLP